MRPGATLLLVLALIACGDPEAGPRLDVGVSPTPATVGPAQIRVSLSDTTLAPGPEARIVVTGRLEDGSGGTVVDTARAVRRGLWVVDSFPFGRPGSWVLHARLDPSDGPTLEGRHTIRVVGR